MPRASWIVVKIVSRANAFASARVPHETDAGKVEFSFEIEFRFFARRIDSERGTAEIIERTQQGQVIQNELTAGEH